MTKALKAVTKRQVFAISDKGGKDNDKAYDVQTFPVVIGRPPAASKRPLCQTIGRRMAHVACANTENAYAFRIHLVTAQQRCGYNSTMHEYIPHHISLCSAGAVTTALCAHPPPHIPLQHISPPHIPSTWHDWQVAFVIIAKHFGSVGVERTCCVADRQKNIAQLWHPKQP